MFVLSLMFLTNQKDPSFKSVSDLAFNSKNGQLESLIHFHEPNTLLYHWENNDKTAQKIP